MRLIGVVLVLWLLIGALATWQRGYFQGADTSCSKAGTIAVSVVAGPTNYFGANPKVTCNVPQPSQ